MFNPTRDQARQFLFDAWHKHCNGTLLTPLEDMAARLIKKHPEFHDVLDKPEQYQDKDFPSEHGAVNPFLHLMMHLSIEEQLSIDQPRGIRTHFERLSRRFNSAHHAQHAMMECLGEMLQQAQRNSAAPDAAVYFSCLEKI